jgi:SAM-dependent methyltransferase
VDLLWSRDPNRFLVAEVADLAPGRALDLACGEGRNAIWLAELGWQVTGVDYSEVAIAKARERAANERLDIEFTLADLLDYEPEPNAFDLVALLYLQIPVDERQRVLAPAATTLAPGGILLLVGHDLTNVSDGVGGPSDVSVLYTPADIVEDLAELEIEKAERVFRDVAGADRPAIDVLVRARRPVLSDLSRVRIERNSSSASAGLVSPASARQRGDAKVAAQTTASPSPNSPLARVGAAPMSRKRRSSRFARCGGEASHAATTSRALTCPHGPAKRFSPNVAYR